MERPLQPPTLNPPVDLLHAAVCTLMTQFIHLRCPLIAGTIAGYLRRLATHPEQHAAKAPAYRELSMQWDALSRGLMNNWPVAPEQKARH